jgi:hypothetical protein
MNLQATVSVDMDVLIAALLAQAPGKSRGYRILSSILKNLSSPLF